MGEVYDQPKIVRKIFKSLTEDFRPKVTTITESKDVDTILVDELVGSLQSYESNLPKTSKSKSMALKFVDDVDNFGFDDEISSIEIAYLTKNFRNFLRNNNGRARNWNNADPKNVKKNKTTKNNVSEKSKNKIVQFSNNSLGQQCFGCQGYGHVKSECPIFLRSKGKVMAVTLSDDEGFDHKSQSDQEENFMAFIATVVASETEIVEENSFDGEFSENDDLQKAYNKLCKIAAKDAMNVDLGLKKIKTLEHEKKFFLAKLFNANELKTIVKIENMSLIERVKSLEFELFIAREQLDRTSTSKLDNMLNVQKSASDKIGLGFV